MNSTEKDMEKYLENVFPQIRGRFSIHEISKNKALVKMKIQEQDLRPGGTVSGPSIFSLADISFYVAVLSAIDKEALAVTTNCSINFLRKPEPTVLFGRAQILKSGKSLIVGDVEILTENQEVIVAHASMTYSIPPKRSGVL